MATIGSAKATLVNKIDSLTSSATAKDTIFLAKALKENTTHHSFTFEGAWANSTAYGLDDVITSGGNTYICILAYTSAAAGSFAVGSNWSLMAGKGTDGTTVGTGTAGQVLKTNSAGTGTEWGTDAAGKVLQTKAYVNSTRTSMPNSNNYWMNFGTFTKISSTSRIIFLATISGWTNNSGSCGIGLRLGHTAEADAYRYGTYTYTAIGGVGHAFAQNADFGVSAAGTKIVYWGWKTSDSGANKPFELLNGNSIDDARAQQSASTIIIIEVEV
jgi:hypothetical protein